MMSTFTSVLYNFFTVAMKCFIGEVRRSVSYFVLKVRNITWGRIAFLYKQNIKIKLKKIIIKNIS